jgi:plasmid replication initiation protein
MLPHPEIFEQGCDIMPTIVKQIREKRDIEIAKKKIEKGMDVDTIVDITGISRKNRKKLLQPPIRPTALR